MDFMFNGTNLTFFWLPILCVFWIACSFISSFIYGIRVGKPEIGFIVGLILGPIGIVVSLLMPGKEKTYRPPPFKTEPQKGCPECNMLIRASSARCVFCGYHFVKASTNPIRFQK